MKVAHQRALSIAFAAVLLFSIIAILPAWALSPITFTTETTIESQHEQFQQVYENGTDSTVYLDANSTGSYFMDSWDGTTLTSLDEQLTNTTYTVDSHAYISPVDLSRYSVDLDGSNDFVNFDRVDLGSDFTYVLRFKMDEYDGVNQKRLLQYGDTLIRLGATGQNIQFFPDASFSGETYTTTVSAGAWHAVAAIHNTGNTCQIWLDGVEFDGGNCTAQDFTPALATFGGTGSNTPNGKLDDLLIYDDVLTDEELNAFFSTGAFPTDNLITRFDVNNGVGTSVTDMSGNGHTGTFSGNAAWSSDVATLSTSRPTIYVTGRDSSGANGVGKWNLADLSEVDDEYFASDLAPLDIAQSTSNIYTAAINGTAYGTLFDVSMTRSFGSYTETAIVTGDATTPAFAIYYDENTSNADQNLNNGGTLALAELISGGSAVVGDELNTIILSLSKDGSPTGTAKIGVFDSSANPTFTCAELDVSTLTTSQLTYGFFCPSGHTVAANDRIGIKYTGGDGSNLVEVFYQSVSSQPNASLQGYVASWAAVGGASADLRAKFAHVNSKVVVYDGSPDTRYYFFESGTSDELRAVKRTGSTTLIATAMDHTAGESFSVVQLTDRIIIQTATDTYQLLTSTDAITEIHPNAFNTRYAQTFEIAPAARTFNTNAMYVANSTYATNYTPNTGANARTGVFIDDVNTGGSGTIEAFDPTKYYYLSVNDLTVEASSTTWTIKDVGTKEQVEIEAYTEDLGIDLLENTTSILAEDVIRLVCDNGDYLIEIQYFAVGSDADCNTWKTLDVSGAATGRMLSYAASGEVVHTTTYTDYTVQLTVANPSVYELTTIYDGKDVDSGAFDSGGNTEQRFLLGQCYILQIVEESTGNTLQTGTICAGGINPITISLSGIVIPDDWLRSTWSYSIQRNYTDNGVLFTFQKSVSPYNGSLYVTDNFDAAEATFDQWYNFTEVTGASIANVTGTTSNMTLYFTLYENGTPVINAVSNAEVEIDNPFSVANFGLLFGVPLAFIFPVLTAAMFPKSLAYFGSIVTVAVIGIMSIFGYITLPLWFWAVIMPVLAFAIFVGHKR